MPTSPEKKMHLIPCDRDCYHQEQGYCTLDEITYITDCTQNGCGYFSATDPYSSDHIDRI